MDLHHADGNDWSKVKPQDCNGWQRLAARTNGLVTPGNLITIIGAFLVLCGLVLLAESRYVAAVIWIIVGRLADILDGMAAQATGTKGPVGETLDAAVDKVLLFTAGVTLLRLGILPWFIAATLAIQFFFNIAVVNDALRLGHRIHPSATGKFSALFTWVMIGLYAYRNNFTAHSTAHSWLTVLAISSFAVCIILAAHSSRAYYREFRQLKK